jgi:hypothetical protein
MCHFEADVVLNLKNDKNLGTFQAFIEILCSKFIAVK